MIRDILLRQSTTQSFDPAALHPEATGFSITTDDGEAASADPADGRLTLTPGPLGHADFGLGSTDADGAAAADRFRALVAGENAYSLALLPDAQSYTSTNDPDGTSLTGRPAARRPI